MKRKSFTELLSRLGKYAVTILFPFVVIYVHLSLRNYQIGTNLITGDWIVHSSEQYCYSLEFPGRWRLYVSGDEGWHGGVRPFQRAMIIQPKPHFLGGTIFRVDQVSMNQPTSEKLAAWSLANQDEMEKTISALEPYPIAGDSALTRTLTGSSSIKTEVYVIRETDGLVLSMITKARFHEDALKIFRQIVESFNYENCFFSESLAG
jgi:hypothetical protein